MKSNLIDIEVYVHHETEKACLVSLDGDRGGAVWIPLSLIELEKVPGKEKTWILTGPRDVLTDKGLT